MSTHLRLLWPTGGGRGGYDRGADERDGVPRSGGSYERGGDAERGRLDRLVQLVVAVLLVHNNTCRSVVENCGEYLD